MLGKRSEGTEDIGARGGDSPATESVGSSSEAEAASNERPEGLRPGAVVASRYRILSEIGRGGFAIVYRARDEGSGHDVALKVLRADRLAAPALKRMAREAETALHFSHPNLVRVFGQGRDGDHAFLAMELVEGETLRARIARGPIAPTEAVAIAADLLGALAVLHREGIVHRDLKPSNILLGADGRVRLADLGLVTRWSDDQSRATRSEAIVGTLEYVSPEQALGEELDGRSDLYALGVVLYEMLSGAPLYGPRSSLGALVAHLTKPAPELQASREGVPAWLAAIVARLLAKGRDERYATADEARADLLAGRAPKAAAAASDSRPRVLGLAGFAGVLLLGTAAFLAWTLSPAPEASTPPRIVAAEVVGGAVRALDENGNPLWSRATGAPLHERQFSASELALFPRMVVTDLEGDGSNEVLLAAAAEPGALTDLVIFEANGDLRLRRPSRSRVTFGSSPYDSFGVTTIHPIRDSQSRQRLFVLSTHRPYFPAVLEELTSRGTRLGAYYFAGHQTWVTRFTMQGREVLAIGGFSNETRGGSLTLLDMNRLSGRSPSAKPEYSCSDCPPHDPLAVFSFPRTAALVATAGDEATANVGGIIQMEGGVIDIAVQSGVHTDFAGRPEPATVRYQISSDLSRLVGLGISRSVETRHNALFRAQQLDHRFGPRDIEDLRRVLTWKNGAWTPLPWAPDRR